MDYYYPGGHSLELRETWEGAKLYCEETTGGKLAVICSSEDLRRAKQAADDGIYSGTLMRNDLWIGMKAVDNSGGVFYSASTQSWQDDCA